MTAIDMTQFIVAKSDQLNADDLIGGPMTLEVTKVSASPDSAEQPISIHYRGDGGKPYKPCKSMRRVLVHCWGTEGADYVGRAMTVYRDEGVMFGGIKVGGIRISHVSHIERDTVVALMVTRGKRLPYPVKCLRQPVQRQQQTRRDDIRADSAGAGAQGQTQELTLDQRAEAFLKRLATAANTIKANSMWSAATQLRNELDARDPDRLAEIEQAFQSKFTQLDDAEGGQF